MDSDLTSSNESPRARILATAARLIAAEGVEAMTTRAVATLAQVQAPTLYRLFGDKDGLLDSVSEQVMADYVARKAAVPEPEDPIAALRAGWDAHVEFGLQNPGIFMILIARTAAGRDGAAMRRGLEVLREKIRKLAQRGRLALSENRALDLIQAGAVGVILTLLRQPSEARDMALSADAREATLRALTGEAAPEVEAGAHGAAIALRSRLAELGGLSPGERLLMAELLDRIAGGAASGPPL